jgi:peptidoglycan-associated lipoprotein
MMKRSWGWVGMIVLVVCLSMISLTGCAKKSGLTSGTVTTEDQKAVTKVGPAGVSSADDQAAARARELRDQSLREATAKGTGKDTAEQARKEAAASEATTKGIGTDAAEQAKKEAAAKAAAIMKELQIPEVNFDYDKYYLTPAAQAILKAGAPAYLKYREYKLVVEGHCDERGSAEYNLVLGQKRADECAKFLSDLGIEKERIKTISYGKEMPLDPGKNEEAWAKNRRAQFVIFPPVK